MPQNIEFFKHFFGFRQQKLKSVLCKYYFQEKNLKQYI